MKREMFVIFSVLAGFWLWAEYFLDENPQNILKIEPVKSAEQELVSDVNLKNKIVTTIYYEFTNRINQLANRGIETRDANFDIYINFDDQNNFTLSIRDLNQSELEITHINETLPRSEKELDKLLALVVDGLVSYHLSGLPDEPKKEKIGVVAL